MMRMMTLSRDEVEQPDFGAGLARLDPVTPGEILRDEFMEPCGLSARALARELDVPPNRVTAILNGDRKITAETAILLGRRFTTSPRFWLNLQVAYDLTVAERALETA